MQQNAEVIHACALLPFPSLSEEIAVGKAKPGDKFTLSFWIRRLMLSSCAGRIRDDLWGTPAVFGARNGTAMNKIIS